MLHNEYSDPRSLIDDALATGQFSNLFDAMSNRRDEKCHWDFYLAKVNPKLAFGEYLETVKRDKPAAPSWRRMTQDEIIAQTLAIAGVSYSNKEVNEE